MKTVLEIEGMHCASCAQAIERALKKESGVSEVSVNYATETAEVTHGAKVSAESLKHAVHRTGYAAHLPGEGGADPHAHDHSHDSSRRDAVLSLALAVPLLLLAMGPMLGLPLPHSPWLGAAELALAAAILWLGRDIFRQGTLGAVRQRRANMDTLIALGTGVAFLYSAVVLARAFLGAPLGPLYFESAGLIMAFILLGRHLENKAKRQTGSALEELLRIAPEQARLYSEKEKQERLVDVAHVKKDDLLRIKPGDKVPVDGTVTVGNSRIDESMLTGESKPVKKGKGDTVFAGTINRTGMFLMRAERTGKDTAFNRIVELVARAQRSQAPVQRLADQVSAVFVPAVLILASLSFIVWMLLGAPAWFALQVMISVLIISCPCALGLATPTAVSVAVGTAGKRGILFKEAKSLQKAASVRMVAFDKTGTLTRGRPEVQYLETYNDLAESIVLRYAASMEVGSEHPLGEAIIRHAESKKVDYGEPRTFEAVEGKGVKGKAEGRKIHVGSIQFFRDESIGIYDVRMKLDELAKRQLTPVLVAIEGKLAGLIGIADPLKDSAKPAVYALTTAGYDTLMLTGDNQQVAEAVAAQAGIGVVRAQLTPRQKLTELGKLQKKRPVAMVGDGINDAPALAKADLGVAIGSGTAVAVESGDVVIVDEDLGRIPEALAHAKRAMRIIKQNLGWAFGYNIVAVPIAMGVLYPSTGWLLSPALAGAAMAASSLSVVLNSLRLRN